MRIARLMAAGGSSGIYLDRLFERWGIAPQVRAKAVLVPGGPLPAEIQNYTVYAGALSAETKKAAAARELLAALRGPKAAEVLKTRGMEAP
jgi:molybdate transport system substrate-binding protein